MKSNSNQSFYGHGLLRQQGLRAIPSTVKYKNDISLLSEIKAFKRLEKAIITKEEKLLAPIDMNCDNKASFNGASKACKPFYNQTADVCKFSKNVKSKLHRIENSKTRGQTV